jgi:hypothetical protein
MAEAMDVAQMVANSSLVPKAFINKPGDILVAMLMGKELGLNPMQAIQNIAVINGKPSIYGDALLALVQNHATFVSIEESYDDATKTAICKVQRKGAKPHTEYFSMEDAKTAGLQGKSGPWTQYPKRMQAMRARGFALRNQFADALCGLISAEEANDYPVDMGMAEVVKKAPREEAKPELPEYTSEQFKSNFPGWNDSAAQGKFNAERLIKNISVKYALSDKQIEMINGIHVGTKADPAQTIEESVVSTQYVTPEHDEFLDQYNQ